MPPMMAATTSRTACIVYLVDTLDAGALAGEGMRVKRWLVVGADTIVLC